MKSSHLSLSSLAQWSVLATGVVLLGTQVGCSNLMFWRSKPQVMHSAASVPASKGTVKTTKGDNGNTNVAIRVEHLALPSRIVSDATVYVVWIQPMGGEKQNVGALTIDKDLEGRLDTVTAHHRFSVMVTPEPSGQATQPSNEAVFTTNVESSK